MNRDIPKPNEVFRHFKGNCYKIIAVGHHSETKEKMVLYRALYEDGIMYIPIYMTMFI